MPCSAQHHRMKTGSFLMTLMKIIGRKCNNCSNRKTRKSTHSKNLKHKGGRHVQIGLLSCVTTVVLYFIALVLLSQCPDIQKNPGPSETEDSGMKYFQQNLEKHFSIIMHSLQQQGSMLSQKIDDRFDQLGRALTKMKKTIGELTRASEQIRADMDEIIEDQQTTWSRLDALEEEMDRLDSASRKANLKFLGIPEYVPENNDISVETIVEVLNYHSTSRQWKKSDIEYAQRVGRKGRQPRPMIVAFRNCDDKRCILQDRDLRYHLSQSYIKVTTDLTPRQRAQVQYYRDKGKQAYFKNGRLHVEDGNTYPNRTHSQYSEKSHANRYSTYHTSKEHVYRHKRQENFSSGERDEIRHEKRHAYRQYNRNIDVDKPKWQPQEVAHSHRTRKYYHTRTNPSNIRDNDDCYPRSYDMPDQRKASHPRHATRTRSKKHSKIQDCHSRQYTRTSWSDSSEDRQDSSSSSPPPRPRSSVYPMSQSQYDPWNSRVFQNDMNSGWDIGDWRQNKSGLSRATTERTDRTDKRADHPLQSSMKQSYLIAPDNRLYSEVAATSPQTQRIITLKPSKKGKSASAMPAKTQQQLMFPIQNTSSEAAQALSKTFNAKSVLEEEINQHDSDTDFTSNNGQEAQKEMDTGYTINKVACEQTKQRDSTRTETITTDHNVRRLQKEGNKQNNRRKHADRNDKDKNDEEERTLNEHEDYQNNETNIVNTDLQMIRENTTDEINKEKEPDHAPSTYDRSSEGESPTGRQRANSASATCFMGQCDNSQGRSLRSKTNKERSTSQTTITHAFKNSATTKKTSECVSRDSNKTIGTKPGHASGNQDDSQ